MIQKECANRAWIQNTVGKSKTGLRMFVFSLNFVDSINMIIIEHPPTDIISAVYTQRHCHSLPSQTTLVGCLTLAFCSVSVTTYHNKLCSEGMMVHCDKPVGNSLKMLTYTCMGNNVRGKKVWQVLEICFFLF